MDHKSAVILGAVEAMVPEVLKQKEPFQIQIKHKEPERFPLDLPRKKHKLNGKRRKRH